MKELTWGKGIAIAHFENFVNVNERRATTGGWSIRADAVGRNHGFRALSSDATSYPGLCKFGSRFSYIQCIAANLNPCKCTLWMMHNAQTARMRDTYGYILSRYLCNTSVNIDDHLLIEGLRDSRVLEIVDDEVSSVIKHG